MRVVRHYDSVATVAVDRFEGELLIRRPMATTVKARADMFTLARPDIRSFMTEAEPPSCGQGYSQAFCQMTFN